MRTISAQAITDTVARLCIEANTRLPKDVEAALAKARAEEPWPLAKNTLDLLWSNLSAAKEENLPICQDTGMACVFVELGTDVHIDGHFEEAIHEGVRRGYTDGYLRKSIVADPLRRGNTGDNTPAAITVHLVDGDGCTITVELRSVNNRYLDCNIRLPRLYLFAEEAMKSRIQNTISRGKVDVFVTLDNAGAEKVQVSVNKPVADGYYAALKQLAADYDLAGDISVSLLSRFPDVLLAEKAEEDVEQMAKDICSVLDRALADFDQMRSREGQRLKDDVLSRAKTIEDKVALVEERSPQTVAEYRAKLEARMTEVLSNTQLDPARILTEAAIFADKVAVDEETVRLRSHIGQLREMLDKGGATGRKLDFLIQEFNREANTIGSKCSDIDIARHVVDIKAEIEKIREQVQNIE